ncbi:MAG: RCC1 domain-containing protein, partial [Solirubrobacteraceae bacterium]
MKQRWPWALLLLAAAAIALPAGAAADQSSQPSSPVAGHIAAGESHSCALISAAARCWGFGGNGRLGYDNTNSIGDNEIPAAAGPISLGAGRAATAVTAGHGHTCALLDDATVRCWGFGGNGRLGYDNTTDVDDPDSVDPVDFGGGRTATAISAGDAHTCAVLDDGTVRCWGYAAAGQLGYGDTTDVDDPGSVGPVELGGVKATAITAGESHTCALLEDGTVRCWGYGLYGQLGNGDNDPDNLNIGDDELPTFKPPVFLGAGRTATAISAGNLHTCARLDNGTVRCWGFGGNGQLGYANTSRIGDNETPGSLADPVNLGLGRTATAISAGRQHSCAILDNGRVRCWGGGSFGQLGYGNQRSIGDDETPGSAGPVALGAGRTAIAIDTGVFHTCALLDTTSVRCWGYGANGRLGYCNEVNVGDTETPAAIGPVNLGAGGAGCAA